MKRFFANFIVKHTKTVGKKSDIDDIVRPALILQTAFGQQVLDPNWSWKRFSIRNLFSLFLYIYGLVGTIDTFRSSLDVDLIAEACYTLIMIGLFPIKLLLFINNKDIFRELYVETKTTLVGVIEESSDIGLTLLKAKKIVKVLFVAVTVPVLNHELLCIWGYVTNNLAALSLSISILMPMKFPYFEIAWFLHSIFLIMVSTAIILDMWFLLFTLFLCAGSDSLVKLLKVDQKRDDETEEMYGQRLNETLKRFYKHHVKQMRFSKTMNKMYKWLALVPMCNAAMCICIILLLLSKDLNWKFAPHFLPMFAEIFAYNYFGEQIKTKAFELNQALHYFEWTSLPMKERKSYCIIMTFMEKQFGIKTGNGRDLSLINMTSVLEVTYRAFTMLQSV